MDGETELAIWNPSQLAKVGIDLNLKPTDLLIEYYSIRVSQTSQASHLPIIQDKLLEIYHTETKFDREMQSIFVAIGGQLTDDCIYQSKYLLGNKVGPCTVV